MFLSIRIALFGLLVAGFALAQQAGELSPNEHPKCVLRGRILDADSGQAVTRQLLVAASTAFETEARTEALGDFTLKALSPGSYRVEVNEPGNRFPIGEEMVTVKAGTENSSVDIFVRLRGSLSGILRDREGEPVPRSKILLVIAEYWFGKLSYYARDRAITDDRGYYSFPRVDAGKSYLLLAMPAAMPAEFPTEQRPSILAASWYPSRPEGGGLTRFVLKSGEDKYIDIDLERSPSYCVDGNVTANGSPAAVNFEVAVKETSGFVPASNRLRGEVVSGQSAKDGRFRVCGLWPGHFRVTTGSDQMILGSALFSVSDTDVHGIRVDARSPATMTGEVMWQPGIPVPTERQTVTFTPVNRSLTASEAPHQVELTVPGSFTVQLPAATQYYIEVHGSDDTYLKSVTCGGGVIADRVLEYPEAGCKLHIVLANDSGRVTARAIHRDNTPAPNSEVCLVPLSARTPAEVSASARCGRSELETSSVSIRATPGMYYALAGPRPRPVDWAEDLSTHAVEGVFVEVVPGGSKDVAVELK